MPNLDYENIDRTDYWEQRHAAWMEKPDLQNLETKDKWFEDRFYHILPPSGTPKPFTSVLDFGCGCGLYAPALSRRFKYYTGMDTSLSAINFATEHFRDGNRVFLRSGHRTGSTKFLADHTFDCIFSCTVLQHMTIEERIKVVEEFKRLLKPGGIYVGLEMQNGHAPDMPTWDNQEWMRTWLPMKIILDAPDDNPDWVFDNVWYGRMP